MLLGKILMSILFRQGVDKDREILVYQIHDREKKRHAYNSDSFLIAAYVLGPLIVSVTEAAPDMLTGGIAFLLWFGEDSVLLTSLLRFRIIKTRSVIELADLLCSEKIETESHILCFVLFKIIYGSLRVPHYIPPKSKFKVFYLTL